MAGVAQGSCSLNQRRQRAFWFLALFFCLSADVQDGLGPFLGVRLQELGWRADAIGWMLTLPALTGLVFSPFLGALCDRSMHKRAILVLATVVVLAASLLSMSGIPLWVVIAQIAVGIACAAFLPAGTALILGLAGNTSLSSLLGRAEAARHVGTCLAAALAGFIGLFGLAGLGTQSAVFVMGIFGLMSLAALACISPQLIDNKAARGLDGDQKGAESLSALFTDPSLLGLGLVVFFFHLGNAAMLPLLGQAAVARFGADPSAATGGTIFLAQITMVAAALWGARLVRVHGCGYLIVIACVVLVMRGLIAGFWESPWSIVPVQILDGVGAGLMGVATPGFVAVLLAGTGRINLGLGSVLLMQGIGASISNAIGGHAAHAWRYETAFVVLAAAPLAGIIIYMLNRRNAAFDKAARLPI